MSLPRSTLMPSAILSTVSNEGIFIPLSPTVLDPGDQHRVGAFGVGQSEQVPGQPRAVWEFEVNRPGVARFGAKITAYR